MRFRLGFLPLFTLSILTFCIYMLASAQEDFHVEVDSKENSADGAVIIIESAPSSDATPQRRVFMRSDNGNTIIMDNEKSGGSDRRSERRADRGQRMRQESPEPMKRDSMQKDASPDADSAKKWAKRSQMSLKIRQKAQFHRKNSHRHPFPVEINLGSI